MYPKSSGYSPVPTSEPPPPSSSPATIPISSSPSPPPPPPPPPPTTTTTATDLINQIKSQSQTLISAQRPWQSLLNPSSISVPQSPSLALQRLRINTSFFRSNYALAVLLILALSLLSHPLSLLLSLALAFAWLKLFISPSGPVVLFGRSFEDSSLLGSLSLATLFIFLFTDVGGVLFGAFLWGIGLVAAHAILRGTDDLPVEQLPVTMPAAAAAAAAVTGFAFPVQQAPQYSANGTPAVVAGFPVQQGQYGANGNSNSYTGGLPASRPM